MEFLSRRLEEITKNQVVVVQILKYLHNYSANPLNCMAAKLKNFHEKWDLDNYVGGMFIAYIKGDWTPISSAKESEIKKQKPWDYVMNVNFKCNKTSTGCNSTVPFAFKEMILHAFWKDLYDCFGLKVVLFILEKSLIITETGRNFFVIVGKDTCTLYKKLLKAKFISIKKGVGGDFSNATSFNPYVFESQRFPSINYSLSAPLPSPKNKRKRNRSEEGSSREFLETIQNAKKLKTLEIENPTSDSLLFPCISRGENMMAKSSAVKTQKIIRWFQPSVDILKRIVNEREYVKQTNDFTISRRNIDSEPSGLQQLSFVGIMQNEEFSKISKNELYTVIKEYEVVDFNCLRVPEGWQGLLIREPTCSNNTSRKYAVNVYFISEVFARKHNVRIKRKQRRKRKQNECSPPSVIFGTLHPERRNKTEKAFCLTGTGPSCSLKTPEFSRPFDPLIPLETIHAFYNKSSWTIFPKCHILSLACSSSVEEGVQVLLTGIFATEIGSSFLDFELKLVRQSSMVSKLEEILKFFINMHKRVKNLHLLVKRCLTHWIIKAEEKFIRKEMSRNERRQWRTLYPKNPKRKRGNESMDVAVISAQAAVFSNLNKNTHDLCFNNTPITAAVNTVKTNSLEFKKTSPLLSQDELKIVAYKKLKETIPNSVIMMTLRQILHISGLESALGSKKNLKSFFSFLRKSLVLAGTKSCLQLGQMMAQIDVKSCPWLDDVASDAMKNCLMAKLLKWIFVNYILRLLRSSFYITEISASRMHASFYLRETWKSVSESVCHRLLKSKALQYIGPVSKVTTSRFNSKIRFVPKKNHDLRPIVSFKPAEGERKLDERQAKMILNHAIEKKYPHRVRDNGFVHQRWSNFLKAWQSQGRSKLFFVKADIQNAYPSVNISKLRVLLDDLANELNAMTQKDFKVISSSRLLYRQAIMSGPRPKLTDVWNASMHMRPCMVVATEKEDEIINARNVFQKMFPFVNENILKIGKKAYLFNSGLPQGWRLSESLCNIYYGAMDSKHLLKYVTKECEMLMVTVDDYLYITPYPSRARRFLEKLQSGFPDYNCCFNPDKIQTNLYPVENICPPLHECEWITQTGLILCLTCGHAMRDFSSYAGQDMASTISFVLKNVSNPENFLISRMKLMLPARLNMWLLDPAVNCQGRIILNIWEAGLIFAFRYYAICRVIYPSFLALKNLDRVKQNISAIMGCAKSLSKLVLRAFESTYPAHPAPCRFISGKKRKCPCISSFHNYTKHGKPKNLLPETEVLDTMLDRNEILYIVYHAFVIKLKCHSGSFEQILPKLNKLKSVQETLISEDRFASLRNILGTKMPWHFQNIKV